MNVNFAGPWDFPKGLAGTGGGGRSQTCIADLSAMAARQVQFFIIGLASMLTLRPGTAHDLPTILKLIRGLAEYEREPQSAVATDEDLMRDGFGPEPKFWVILAEWNGAPAGFAFYFFNYSTWRGRPGLYLEDLFVPPEFRGKGIGKALFVEVARMAVRENCARMQWQVLDWNQPAIDFYRSLGAQMLQEWLTMRLDDDALKRLAGL